MKVRTFNLIRGGSKNEIIKELCITTSRVGLNLLSQSFHGLLREIFFV
jgi:hypothetical protein